MSHGGGALQGRRHAGTLVGFVVTNYSPLAANQTRNLFKQNNNSVITHRSNLNSTYVFHDIHFYSPYNMVAQANKTEISKNTTNKKEKK